MNQRELRQQLMERFPRERRYLLPALHYVQHELGHLPEFALQTVGWHLHIPASEVFGAATSYSELRIEKPGAHIVRVCTGLACALNGAQAVLDAVRHEVATAGGTPPDDSVTLEESPCLFACGVAPVMEADGALHGRATLEQARGLVAEYRHAQDERPSGAPMESRVPKT
ncbi:MAG: NAD(P)H-dependent oxidoreductase subunit E [Dehalococcoidia bacterium]|nr:NAD(P)H-dependent oxidoreductase subunit E [Dehalococcoidia bacterium]